MTKHKMRIVIDYDVDTENFTEFIKHSVSDYILENISNGYTSETNIIKNVKGDPVVLEWKLISNERRE